MFEEGAVGASRFGGCFALQDRVQRRAARHRPLPEPQEMSKGTVPVGEVHRGFAQLLAGSTVGL